MTFPKTVIDESWLRATGNEGGQWAYCECERKTHGHDGKCGKRVAWNSRGRQAPGAWEAHHKWPKKAGGKDITSNCEILCWECHKDTF